jgi:uncharacterized cupin superfamily protein
MTTTTPTPSAGPDAFLLDRTTVVHLATDLSMRALGVDQGAWSRRDGTAQFVEGRLLSVFAYEATWTWWERHPAGEEFVHVLSGSVAFRLDDGSTERTVSLAAGESLLVPRASGTVRTSPAGLGCSSSRPCPRPPSTGTEPPAR